MHYYLYLTRSMYNSFKVNTHESRIILSGKNKKKKKRKLYSSHTADGSLGLFSFFQARLNCLLVQRAHVKQNTLK